VENDLNLIPEYKTNIVTTNYFKKFQTLLNNKESYLGSMLSAYFVLVIMAVLAFKVAGGSLQNLRSIFARKLPSDMRSEDVTVVSPTT
jgi:hypothetical protein